MPYHGTKLRWESRRVQTAHAIIGEAVYQPGGSCGPRTQRDFQFVVLHSGECRVTVDDKLHELTTGRVYRFLPEGREIFRFDELRESHHSWCAIRPSLMPERLRKLLIHGPFSVRCSEIFSALLATALKLRFSHHDASVRTLVEHLALGLCAEYLHLAGEPESEEPESGAVRKFLLCIEESFAKEDCLKVARAAAGVSRNTLFQKLREALQTTPAKYLWRFRMERGAAMLAETGLSISEVAYHCGFKNPFHFSRMLKRQLGKSPKTIRHESWVKAAE